MTNRILRFLIAMSLVWICYTPIAIAQTAEEKGLEIAREADRRDTGFQDYDADMEMILRNRHGEQSIRHMRNKTLEMEGDGDKALIIFDQPRDIKGTAFLSFTHAIGADDQWLYLPALKRVKRISSNNKSGPFVGSEFAYEDLSSQEVDKYTYKFLRDEVYNGMDCFVLQRYPVDKNSGYTHQIGWIDKEEYRVWKIEFYDRKSELMKTLVFEGYQQYLNQYWRADKMFMVNHQTEKSTDLIWTNYKFRNGFVDADFNRNSLARAR